MIHLDPCHCHFDFVQLVPLKTLKEVSQFYNVPISFPMSIFVRFDWQLFLANLHDSTTPRVPWKTDLENVVVLRNVSKYTNGVQLYIFWIFFAKCPNWRFDMYFGCSIPFNDATWQWRLTRNPLSLGILQVLLIGYCVRWQDAITGLWRYPVWHLQSVAEG